MGPFWAGNIWAWLAVNVLPIYLGIGFLVTLLALIPYVTWAALGRGAAAATVVALLLAGGAALAIPGHGPKRYGDAPGWCVRADIVWKNLRPLRYKPHRGCARYH